MNSKCDEHSLISVVMPLYNGEAYIAEAIESILAQTHSHFEFIIVNDGSTDGSWRIVSEYASRDARIRPLFQPHGGISRAMNAGVVAALGEVIAYIDQDDVALPNRFAVQLEWMRKTGIDICGGCAKRFGNQNALLWFPESHAEILSELIFRCALLQPTVMLRATIAKANPFDLQCDFEDYELWTRLALLYRMGNIPQVLIKYRSHEGQTHVLESAKFRHDLIRFQQRYLHQLFPDASEEDCNVLARLAKREPFTDLAELGRAGKWLIRLAQGSDDFLRQRMADRWQAACRRSAKMGFKSYRIYRQMAPQFCVPMIKHVRLLLACALKLKPGSRLELLLRWLKSIQWRDKDAPT